MLRKADHSPAIVGSDQCPVLVVVIDTEEEFDWEAPFDRASIGTSSIAAQPMMHERVFNEFAIVPTYMCDWPVVTTPASVRVLKGLMEQGRCEIGAHLHPWVSPPHEESVTYLNSYAGNLPRKLEYEKLKTLTTAIVDSFGKAPLAFKAGRYGLGPYTAESITELGYEIDASVVPYTSFRHDGGPDFSAYDEHPYWFKVGRHELLELPVTTGYAGYLRRLGPQCYELTQRQWARKVHIGGILARAGLLERIRLSPEVANGDEMRRLTKALLKDGCHVFSLTYHSPSMVAGHTPYVRTASDLEQFITTIHNYCTWFRDELGGQFSGLNELKQRMARTRAAQTADLLASA